MKTFLITLAAIASYHIILKLTLKALTAFNNWLKSEIPVETESASMSFKDRLEQKKQEK